MANSNEKLNQLQARLDKMVEYQNYFYREINQIRDEIQSLKAAERFVPPVQNAPIPVAENYNPPPRNESKPHPHTPSERPRPAQNQTNAVPNFQTAEPRRSSGIEEFIGKNLFSLIGIIITIIGVGIGAKYAIDRDLISPATRIGLGYAFAGAVLAVAFWLKSKYLNFSAVLLSGALAMIYFLTFFAYSFYELIPQRVAFALMLLVTAFTVAAAINYSRQVIAHIGLVGAYAVPFLLSNGSGQVAILFGYITIVNFGILLISVVKFWKPLYYTSFIFTWLIYASWFLTRFDSAEHFALAFTFLSIFFATFYLTFVSYRLIADEEFNYEIVFLILVNSFIFYAFGYAILVNNEQTANFAGLFTFANALIHFFLAFIVNRYKLGGKINLYLPVALTLTFLTIAIPIQTRGELLTLFWTAETLFLFVIGRTKRILIFEIFSYPLLFLASAALLSDWGNATYQTEIITPFLNKDFLVSAFFAAALALMIYVNRRKSVAENLIEDFRPIVNVVLPAIFLVVLYNTFRTEIAVYFYGESMRTAVQVAPVNPDYSSEILKNDSLYFYNIIWQLNYSMLFLTILSFLNIKKFQSRILGFANVGLNAFVVFIFLTVSLYYISELRDNYLQQTDAAYFARGTFHLLIRYVSYVFVAGLLFASYKYFKCKFLRETMPDFPFETIFDLSFSITLLWIFSSELLNLADVFGFSNSYKLALSILWGIYALALIAAGIYKRKKHLRIGAIVLFAVTLIKLFFYDIADLDTISKTVIFVTLGVLLLIISFLYNKYKDLIFENSHDAEQEFADETVV